MRELRLIVPGIAVDSFVGNYIPLPPQQYTQRQEGR